MSVTGSGTELDPYVITTWGDLMEAQTMMEANFAIYPWTDTNWWVLAADIDASGHDFTPIGSWWDGHECGSFLGHFDGQGHKISHLTINRTCEDEYEYFGLFAYIGDWADPGYVKRLLLEDIQYNLDMNGWGYNDTGGLCAWISAGEFEDVRVTGSITITGPSEDIKACGFAAQIGYNAGGRLGGCKRCSADVDIVVNDIVDPDTYISLAGFSQWYAQFDASECFAEGSIDAGGVGYASVQGFATFNCPSAVIGDCYSRVDISNIDFDNGDACGLGGCYYNSLARCYAAGILPPNNPEWDTIDGFGWGIMDYEEEGIYHVLACYWDAEKAGTWRVPDRPGQVATPKTTSEMKDQATFQGADPAVYEGWLAGADDDSEPIGGVHQSAQAFYTASRHKVDGIRLLMYRVGNPTIINVSLVRQGWSDPWPPLLDPEYLICSGSFDCSSLTDDPDADLIDVDMDASGEVLMWQGYCVVVSGVMDAENYVVWKTSTTAELLYNYGDYLSSDDSGVNWTRDDTRDALFALLEYGEWDFEDIWAMPT